MKIKEQNLKSWFKSGSPWVWMTASGVSIAVIMTIGLLAVIAVRGLANDATKSSMVSLAMNPASGCSLMSSSVRA